MTSRSLLPLAGAVVVLCGASAWFGARMAPSTAPETPARDEGPADADPALREAIDELGRRLGYVERRLEAVERVAANAAQPAAATPGRPGAGDRWVPSHAGERPGPRTGTPAPAAPDPEQPPKTDEEHQREQAAKIRSIALTAARSAVPAQFAALADDGPGADDARRFQATLDGRQMAMSVGVLGGPVDDLVEIFRDQAAQLARDVGPLVRDGLDKADPSAVQTKLDAIWAETDRRARDVLGDRFEKFLAEAETTRKVVREVVAARGSSDAK